MRIQRIKPQAILQALIVIPLVSLGLATTSQAQTTVAGSTPGQFAVSPGGAATYRIPIQVPPSVAGMAPKLELVYNSQSGNGMLGVGWNLSGLSTITRCPRTKTSDGVMGSVNFDANDRFCLDGQRLILTTGTVYGAPGTEYRTEMESFSKITAVGTAGSGPASFTVKTKSGLTMEFGGTADSAIEAIKAPGSTATWPTATIRVWAQNKVTDVKGNFYAVSYDEDAVNGAYYPKQIDYTGNATSIPTLLPNASVKFVSTTPARLDVEMGYQASALTTRTKRIGSVQAFSGTTLMKDYRISYGAQNTSLDKSKIVAVTECDGMGMCLQPINAVWGNTTSGMSPLTGSTLAPNDYSGYASRFVDVNGDGISDMVVTYVGASGINIRSALGRGDGTFAPLGISSSLATNNHAGYTFQYMDVNGDGIPDFVLNYVGTSGVGARTALGLGDGTFAPLGVTSWLAPNDYSGYAAQFVDVNGDGIPDMVVTYLGTSGINIRTALGLGDGTFAPLGISSSLATNNHAGYTFQYMDVNGDGIPDFVLNYVGTSGVGARTALGLGDGTFAPLGVTSWLAPNNYAGYTSQFSDVNGDGIPDFLVIHVGPSGVIIQSSLNGATVLANSIATFSLSQGQIRSVALGPLTTAAVYTKDTGTNKAVYPKLDIQSPMYVVSSVTSSNGVGGVNTTNYTYGGLKAEIGRGMLGFRWTKSTELATGIESYTEYRQDFPFTGIPLMSETRLAGKGNAGVLKRNTNEVACKIPLNGSACAIQTQCYKADSDATIKAACIAAANARYFPVVTSATEASWDLNAAAFPVITTTTSYVADANGQLYGDVGTITVGTNDGAYKQTVNQYFPADTTNWILGRLKSATVTSVKP